jgi:hypothetical protein
MLRNFILVALRNFRRQKLFSVLNMFGLALGLASAILIFLYVSDELDMMSFIHTTVLPIVLALHGPTVTGVLLTIPSLPDFG